MLGSLEAAFARLEEALGGHASVLREQVAAARVEIAAVKATADSAHAGVRALADMLPVAWSSPAGEGEGAAPYPPTVAVPAAEDPAAATGGGAEAGPSPASRRGARAPKPKGV